MESVFWTPYSDLRDRHNKLDGFPCMEYLFSTRMPWTRSIAFREFIFGETKDEVLLLLGVRYKGTSR